MANTTITILKEFMVKIRLRRTLTENRGLIAFIEILYLPYILIVKTTRKGYYLQKLIEARLGYMTLNSNNRYIISLIICQIYGSFQFSMNSLYYIMLYVCVFYY